MAETVLHIEQSKTSTSAAVWQFLALTFAISWTWWIAAICMRASESALLIGSAGPAIAALILSGGSRSAARTISARRIVLFVLALAAGVVIFSLNSTWRERGTPWPVAWNWLGLAAAASPALIVCTFGSLRGETCHTPFPSSKSRARWCSIALLIFPAMLLAGNALAHWLHQPLVVPPTHGTLTVDAGYALVIFLYNITFAGLLEEPGWRGFLLPHLEQNRSPLVSTLVVWLFWALWHAPLDFSRPGGFSLPFYLESRIVFLIPIAVILTWIYNRSQSLAACVIFHANMNTFPFVMPYWMPSFALLFVLAGGVIVSDRMWRSPHNEGQRKLPSSPSR